MELTESVKKEIDGLVRAAIREETAKFEATMTQRFAPLQPHADALARDIATMRREQEAPKRGHGVGYDPFEGKALDFVRFVKAHAVAKMRGADPAKIAEAWGHKRVAELMTARGAALTEQVMADGGALVPDEFSSEFIELLRSATVVRASGARVVAMNGATLTMGRQNTAGSAAYMGEDENIVPSKQGFGQLQASVKKLAALTPISNDLLRDNAISAEMLVRDDLVAVMARKEDITFIRSTGTQYTPKGILYWTASGNKFNATQAGASATAAEVTADLAKLHRLVDESDVNVDLANAAGAVGWLMTPRSKWYLFGMVSTEGTPLFRAELMTGKLWNHPVRTTTQIPNNLGGGTNESEVYFGVFSEALITENTSLIVDAFPGGTYHDGSALVSGISKDQTVIRAIARHDFLVRHTNCFAVLQAVKWGA